MVIYVTFADMEKSRKTTEGVSIRTRAVATAAVAALVAGTLIGSAAPAGAATGDMTEFPLSAGSTPYGVVAGPDDNLWSTGLANSTIARMTPLGTLTTFPTPTPNAQPREIAVGSDGNLWFTEQSAGKIGRITTAGVITEFALPLATSNPMGIAAGPDGALWFTELNANKVGRITTTGTITEYLLPTAASGPAGITAGPEGSNRMYFTQALGSRIGIVTMAGEVTNAVSLPFGAMPLGIATINGSIWFVELNSNSLAHLVSDTTVARIALGAGVAPTDIAAGPESTMWVTADGPDQVWKLTDQGSVVGTYATPTPASGPQGVALGPDGNMWVALRVANKLARVTSGLVPVATKAPELGPLVGIVPGTVMTSAPGTWNYQPISYAYQWQRCSTGTADCADIAGATGATYTVMVDDNLKYLRVGVVATNASGPSERAYSGLVPIGVPPTPPKPQPPVPASGAVASIGSGATAALVSPASQRRGTSRTYRVTFSASVEGIVTLSFKAKGHTKKVKGIAVQGSALRYVWKVPWSWHKGTTTVSASFTPVLGSPYTAGNMIDTVRIR
jgi:virginiamycin B lyase